MVSGPWVNPHHGRGPQDQVTALANRRTGVLDLARNVSKCYQPPNGKLISKDILDVIHDHKMERNLILIKKESDIF